MYQNLAHRYNTTVFNLVYLKLNKYIHIQCVGVSNDYTTIIVLCININLENTPIIMNIFVYMTHCKKNVNVV